MTLIVTPFGVLAFTERESGICQERWDVRTGIWTLDSDTSLIDHLLV
jgi:hypothetical protein